MLIHSILHLVNSKETCELRYKSEANDLVVYWDQFPDKKL